VAARADPAPPRIAPNAPNAPTDADGTARQVCEADALKEQIFRELLTFMM